MRWRLAAAASEISCTWGERVATAVSELHGVIKEEVLILEKVQRADSEPAVLMG